VIGEVFMTVMNIFCDIGASAQGRALASPPMRRYL